MGCDIHTYVEIKNNGKWEFMNKKIFPSDEYEVERTKSYFKGKCFDWRSYGMFGFLADVRNYSKVPPLSKPKGLPDDTSCYVKNEYDYDEPDAHSCSWLSLKELLDFDYDQIFEDLRVMRGNDCSFTANPGDSDTEMTTVRDFLGEHFFRDIEILKTLDPNPENVRVVFWFDS